MAPDNVGCVHTRAASSFQCQIAAKMAPCMSTNAAGTDNAATLTDRPTNPDRYSPSSAAKNIRYGQPGRNALKPSNATKQKGVNNLRSL